MRLGPKFHYCNEWGNELKISISLGLFLFATGACINSQLAVSHSSQLEHFSDMKTSQILLAFLACFLTFASAQAPTPCAADQYRKTVAGTSTCVTKAVCEADNYGVAEDTISLLGENRCCAYCKKNADVFVANSKQCACPAGTKLVGNKCVCDTASGFLYELTIGTAGDFKCLKAPECTSYGGENKHAIA